jgi:leader peptidase (prepilin peptidase)/N-methyltransferase
VRRNWVLLRRLRIWFCWVRNRSGAAIEQPLISLVAALGGAVAAILLLALQRRLREPVERPQAVAQVATTACLLALLSWLDGSTPPLLIAIGVVVFGIPLAFTDAHLHRLPNWLVAGLAITTAVAIIGVVAATGDSSSALRACAAAVALTALHFGLYVLAPGQLGGGDVKLAAPLAAALGWHSWSLVVAGVVLAWVAAAAFVLIGKLAGEKLGQKAIPLGPFLIGGTLVALCVAGR